MPDLLSDLFDSPAASRLPDLIAFARENKLTIGSTTGGRHNKGSRHYSGNAIDIKNSGGLTDQQVAQLSRAASAQGFLLRDERQRPRGQKVWGGPHVHLESPVARQQASIQDDPLAGLFDSKSSEQIPPPAKTGNTPKTGQPSAPKSLSSLGAFGQPISAEQREIIRQSVAAAESRTKPFAEALKRRPTLPQKTEIVTHAMQARTPSYWERLKETVAPYVPGLTSLDTPGGIKTDVPRGVVSGVTLGYAGDPRQVSREEQILDPQAQTRADVAHAVGEYGTAFIPYIGAEKAIGTAIKGTKLLSRAARTGAVFGGVEAARQGVNAIRGRETDLSQIPKSIAVGAASGGLMGQNPGVLRRVGSLVAPQATKEVTEGAPPEQIATSALTNTLFGLAGGSKLEDGLVEAPTVKTEPIRKEITPKPPPSHFLLRERIAQEAEGADRALIRQQFNEIKQGEGLPPVTDTEPVHHSQYQPRRVRGEGKGQFKKGKPVVPAQTEGEPSIPPSSETASAQPLATGPATEADISPAKDKFGAGQHPLVKQILSSPYKDQILADIGAGAKPLEQQAAQSYVEFIRPNGDTVQVSIPSGGKPTYGDRFSGFNVLETASPEPAIAPPVKRSQPASTASPEQRQQIIKSNRERLNSPEFNDILMRESVGGNAGTNRAAVNMVVDPEGRIVTLGNLQEWPKDVQERYRAGELFNVTAIVHYPEGVTGGTPPRIERITGDAPENIRKTIEAAVASEVKSDASTIRSNQEVIQEVSPTGEREGSEVARSENLYRGEQKPVDQIASGEVLTRRQAEPAKTEAEVNPPLARAALQVRPFVEPVRPPILERKQSERSFPKAAEAAGLPGGDNLKYDPITNEESLAKADKRIKQIGVDRAASEIATRKEASADDVATGIRLMQTFTQAGQHERAADVASDLAQKLTQAGQSVQAASIISRLSPEGVLLTAQRQLPTGKKLTSAQSEALVGQARTVQEADARIADLEKQIAEMQANVSANKVSKPKLAQKIGTLEDRLVKLESDARARLEARKAEAVKLGSQAGASAIPLDIADYAIVGAAKITRKGMSTAKWTAEMLSEFGDDIKPHLQKIYRESYSIYDEHRKQMANEAKVRSVRRETPGPMRPEDINRLVEQKVKAQKEGMAARRGLMRTYEDLSSTPSQKALNALTGLRRANLLTGLKTHLRNVTSNTTIQISEELSRPMAALADVAMQQRTGLRTTTLPSVPAATKAVYAAAIKEGPRRAVDIMLGREVLPLEGYKAGVESLGSKMQLHESRTGIKILDAYTNTVFRAMEAGDAVYKVYAFRRELADIAKAQAINEHAADKSLNISSRAKELQAEPTDAMLMQAASYADYATFQNKNMVSSAIAGGKRLIGAGGKFAIEQLAPFDRTPTNIIARTIENSPLGFISAARKLSKVGTRAEAERLAGRIADEAFTAQEQKEFARTFGRASTGTILSALAIILAHKGLLSGASDYDTDKEDYMRKRREFGGGGMLRVPGTHQRVSIIDSPVGKGMATAAGIYEQMQTKKSTDEKLSGSLRLLANAMLLDQPLVRSLREIGESKSVGEAIGTYGASLVPGSAALKAASEATDPEARVIYGQGAKAPLQALTPMTRKSLPRDTGVDQGERGGLSRRLARMADPFNTTTEARGPKKRRK